MAIFPPGPGLDSTRMYQFCMHWR